MLLQSVSKQWGKILGDTVNLKIINFPVSFNECFGGLALFNGDPVAAAEYATITDITNTNFKIYMYANNAGTGYANANIFYLFLGAQPQWGENVGGGGQTVSLPISFEVAFTAVVSADSSWCNASCHITTTTITTMNYQSNRPDIAQAGPVQWLAIGIQPQWGYQTVHGTNPVTYDLPIPFEEAPFTVAISTGNSGNHASCGGFTKTTIVLRAGTTAGVWDTVGFFIIGCQLQWGMISNNKAVFPIAFTAFCSAATLFIRGSGTGTWYGDNANVTLTGLSCITPDYVLNGNFIVIGV